jgi:hypothetical protein
VYHFYTDHTLDLNKFSFFGNATPCGDYIITDLSYEGAMDMKSYHLNRWSESSYIVPKLIKYDETYPSTPEEALDLNCREIFESSAGG